MADRIKPPRSQRLPDTAAVDAAKRTIASTRGLRYRVFFFTIYSVGLRLGEELWRQVGDIDGARGRVHVRDAKGNKDRRVPLPQATHQRLRRFWRVHDPVLLFLNRRGGLKDASSATTPIDAGGAQPLIRQAALRNLVLD